MNKQSDIEIISEALDYFACRAPGCPDKTCLVCKEQAEVRAKAEAAIKRLKKAVNQ